jgi:hypothetical protein
MDDLSRLPSAAPTTAPAAQAPELAASQEELRRATTLLLEQTANQISLADTKAQLTLAADALLVAAITPLGRGIVGHVFDSSLPLSTRVAAAGVIGTFLALLISFYFALVAVRPRLRIRRDHQPTLMYFRQIIRVPEASFIDRFLAQSPEDLLRAVLAETYAQSLIANRKFLGVRWSVIFLLAALVLWAVAQGILAVAS